MVTSAPACLASSAANGAAARIESEKSVGNRIRRKRNSGRGDCLFSAAPADVVLAPATSGVWDECMEWVSSQDSGHVAFHVAAYVLDLKIWPQRWRSDIPGE